MDSNKPIMRLFRKIMLLLCVGWVLCTANGQTPAGLESKIDQYLQPYLEMDAWSGLISIYKNGQPVFQKGYGYADREWAVDTRADTKYRIASISKVFTEVAVLQLVEKGVLSLDDSLNVFLEDYPRGDEITVRHLLTHRSGIPHLNAYPNYQELIKSSYTLEEVIDLFKDKALDFTPGVRYSYSNSGYVLLAYLIEQLSGLSYEAYLQEHLFDPLGLEDTGVDRNASILEHRARGYMFDRKGKLINAEYVDMSIKIGGGSLYSTANDLNRFLQALVKGEILTITLGELPNFGMLDGQEVFTANGRVQGFCHQITHRLEEGLTIAVLGNHYSNIAQPISEAIYQIYTENPYEIPPNYLARQIEVPPSDLSKYEGTYDFGFGPVGTVKMVDGKLGYLAPGRTEYDLLVPIGEHRFFYIQNWVVLEFREEDANAFGVLDWIMGGTAYPAERITDD